MPVVKLGLDSNQNRIMLTIGILAIGVVIGIAVFYKRRNGASTPE